MQVCSRYIKIGHLCVKNSVKDSLAALATVQAKLSCGFDAAINELHCVKPAMEEKVTECHECVKQEIERAVENTSMNVLSSAFQAGSDIERMIIDFESPVKQLFDYSMEVHPERWRELVSASFTCKVQSYQQFEK